MVPRTPTPRRRRARGHRPTSPDRPLILRVSLLRGRRVRRPSPHSGAGRWDRCRPSRDGPRVRDRRHRLVGPGRVHLCRAGRPDTGRRRWFHLARGPVIRCGRAGPGSSRLSGLRLRGSSGHRVRRCRVRRLSGRRRVRRCRVGRLPGRHRVGCRGVGRRLSGRSGLVGRRLTRGSSGVRERRRPPGSSVHRVGRNRRGSSRHRAGRPPGSSGRRAGPLPGSSGRRVRRPPGSSRGRVRPGSSRGRVGRRPGRWGVRRSGRRWVGRPLSVRRRSQHVRT